MTLNVSLEVTITVWDKNGRIIWRKTEPSRSLVRAFLQILLATMAAQSIAVTNIAGASIIVNSSSSINRLLSRGVATDDTEGIVVGTTATAVDITDSKLAAPIAHGTGAGQMVHAAQTNPSDVTTADPDVTFAMNRNFNNNSGGAITVRETGIYCQTSVSAGVGDFCIVRDTPTAVAVPDGGGCNVAYTFKITE